MGLIPDNFVDILPASPPEVRRPSATARPAQPPPPQETKPVRSVCVSVHLLCVHMTACMYKSESNGLSSWLVNQELLFSSSSLFFLYLFPPLLPHLQIHKLPSLPLLSSSLPIPLLLFFPQVPIIPSKPPGPIPLKKKPPEPGRKPPKPEPHPHPHPPPSSAATTALTPDKETSQGSSERGH